MGFDQTWHDRAASRVDLPAIGGGGRYLAERPGIADLTILNENGCIYEGGSTCAIDKSPIRDQGRACGELHEIRPFANDLV